jgi:hypothetical protein
MGSQALKSVVNAKTPPSQSGVGVAGSACALKPCWRLANAISVRNNINRTYMYSL